MQRGARASAVGTHWPSVQVKPYPRFGMCKW